MRFARVSIVEVKPGAFDLVAKKAEAGLLPLFRGQPGFVSYSLIKTSDHSGVSISCWETEDAARDAVKQADRWIKQAVADQVVSGKTVVGEVSFDVRASAPELHPPII